MIPRSVVVSSTQLPPRGARHQPAERRPRARVGHRPGPRQPGRLAGARGQRPRAQRRQLRAVEPAGDGADVPRAVRRAAHPARRRLPAPAARRADRRRAVGGRRADGRRAHAGRLQQRLLRALAARPDDGRRAGRGARPVLRGRPRLDAHHAGPAPGRRHLPAGRRRLPRPGRLPQRLAARQPRAHDVRAQRHGDHRQRGRQRRRRRQARLHLRARPDPVLPERGADPAQRRHVAARGAGRARGGARPARRARGQAGRRLGRQGPRRRSQGRRRPSWTRCEVRLRTTRAAGSRSRWCSSPPCRRSSTTGCARGTPTCARSPSTTASRCSCCPAA